MQREWNCGSAFTLIEVLLTMIIVGVVLFIALPAISAARTTAIDAACLSGIGQSNTLVLGYTESNQGTYPAGEYERGSLTQGTPRSMFVFPGPYQPTAIFGMFEQSTFWPAIVSGGESLAGVSCGGLRPERRGYAPPPPGVVSFGTFSTYHVSSVFYSASRMWLDKASPRESDFAAQRSADVRYPSAKASLFELAGAHRSREVKLHDDVRGADQYPVAFVDGHAAFIRTDQYRLDGVANPITGEADVPFAHTKDGVQGRDVLAIASLHGSIP